MDLSKIKYHNVQESFGMGGPYIGQLEFNGKMISKKFLADSETVSSDKTKIIFSRFVNQEKSGFLGLRIRRDFRIFIYDEPTNCYYQSKDSFDCLAIEKMEGDIIIFHKAFHTSIDKFRDSIEFNDKNFDKIEI
jgi:hypothetical protein